MSTARICHEYFSNWLRRRTSDVRLVRRFLPLAICVYVAAISVRGAELPVAASHLVTGPNSHVELTNTSSQPVTAWTLVVTTTEKDGTTHRSTETVDAYLSEVTKEFSGMSDRVDRLLPGQSREIALEPAGRGQPRGHGRRSSGRHRARVKR